MITLDWNIEKKEIINNEDPSEIIRIGMSLKEFNAKYFKMIDDRRETSAFAPQSFCYKYYDCIRFYFDAEKGILDEIFIDLPFRGRYKGIISIGDKLSQVQEIESTVSIDDDYLIVGDNEIGFVANEDLETIHYDKIGECTIDRIVLF